jgi:AraC family transcriptional regulator
MNPVLLAEVARQEVGVPALLEPREGVHDRTVLIAALLLSDEIDGGELGSNLLVQSVANVLAVHLLRHYSPAGVRLPDLQTVGLDSLRLKRVLDFIEANLGTSLSLDTLADAAGVSAYHFARSFKHATSYSPHQWVVTQRIPRQNPAASYALAGRRCGSTSGHGQPESLRQSISPAGRLLAIAISRIRLAPI